MTARLRLALATPCAGWKAALPDLGPRVRAAARAALRAAAWRPGPAGAELSLVLGDDAGMRALNRHWRGQDKPTNVLSFPAGAAPAGAPALIGDVVLAFETVRREANEQGKPLADHLAHLVVHGVLHLIGYDHEEARAARRMERLEVAILAALGIADPYDGGKSRRVVLGSKRRMSR
jgi:probable rRNA maturation factor